jgi:hypothetical protein
MSHESTPTITEADIVRIRSMFRALAIEVEAVIADNNRMKEQIAAAERMAERHRQQPRRIMERMRA